MDMPKVTIDLTSSKQGVAVGLVRCPHCGDAILVTQQIYAAEVPPEFDGAAPAPSASASHS